MLTIIPAAGEGLRFHDFGRRYPKSILPNHGVPILVSNILVVLDQFPDSKIVVAIGHLGDKIRDTLEAFFPDLVESGQVTTQTIQQSSDFFGPASTIAQVALLHPAHDRILVVLGDVLVEPSARLEDNESYIAASPKPDWSRWCMVKEQNGFAAALFDKPEKQPPTELAITGIYFFEDGPRFYESIDALHTEQTSSVERQISEFLGPYFEKVRTRVRTDVSVTDFGTLSEYLQNRDLPIGRSFNAFDESQEGVVRKSCVSREYSRKIIDEFVWYQCVPDSIRPLLPAIYGTSFGVDGSLPEYSLERVYAPTLREHLLFFDSSEEFWQGAISTIFDVLQSFREAGPACSPRFLREYAAKFKERTEQHSVQKLVSPNALEQTLECYFENVDEVSSLVPDSLFHGDMTLSNIFYEPSLRRVKLIDPLGSLIGNVVYDLGKLVQCFVYGYDLVDSELYVSVEGKFKLYDDGLHPISDFFDCRLEAFYGMRIRNFVHLLAGMQFMALIPLHAHNPSNQKIYAALGQRAIEASSLLG